MTNLNILELENLKMLINIESVNYQKLLNYTDSCTDPQTMQLFKKCSQDTLNDKEKLMSFLSE